MGLCISSQGKSSLSHNEIVGFDLVERGIKNQIDFAGREKAYTPFDFGNVSSPIRGFDNNYIISFRQCLPKLELTASGDLHRLILYCK